MGCSGLLAHNWFGPGRDARRSLLMRWLIGGTVVGVCGWAVLTWALAPDTLLGSLEGLGPDTSGLASALRLPAKAPGPKPEVLVRASISLPSGGRLELRQRRDTLADDEPEGELRRIGSHGELVWSNVIHRLVSDELVVAEGLAVMAWRPAGTRTPVTGAVELSSGEARWRAAAPRHLRDGVEARAWHELLSLDACVLEFWSTLPVTARCLRPADGSERFRTELAEGFLSVNDDWPVDPSARARSGRDGVYVISADRLETLRLDVDRARTESIGEAGESFCPTSTAHFSLNAAGELRRDGAVIASPGPGLLFDCMAHEGGAVLAYWGAQVSPELDLEGSGSILVIDAQGRVRASPRFAGSFPVLTAGPKGRCAAVAASEGAPAYCLIPLDPLQGSDMEGECGVDELFEEPRHKETRPVPLREAIFTLSGGIVAPAFPRSLRRPLNEP